MEPPAELFASLRRRPQMVSSAPGRVDFLNTHQDYKGLPVVPVAINLRTYIAVVEDSGKFEVTSLNLKEKGVEHRDAFPPSNPRLREGKWWGNYLRACVIALQRKKGVKLQRGFKAVVYSQVPVGSGLSSSAALEVSFLKAIDEYFNLGLTTEELAETAFYAENEVMGIPCGRLDQYASAYGGVILLYPRPPVRVEPLDFGHLDLVVVDSGISHSVSEIHPVRQAEINEALRLLRGMEDLPLTTRLKLGATFEDTAWDEIAYHEIKNYVERLPTALANRVVFTLLMHESTMRVIAKARAGSLDAETLAEEVNRQHEFLRDLYEVSLPQLESIRNAMLQAGAQAAKISGAGMGGSLLALTRSEAEAKRTVLQKAMEAGARQGWFAVQDRGASIDFHPQ